MGSQDLKLGGSTRVPYLIADKILTYLSRYKKKVGDIIPSEHELMIEYKAGRSSVREALQILVGMKVLEVRPGKGYYVSREPSEESPKKTIKMDSKQIKDLNDVRLILECETAALASIHATDEELNEMSTFLDRVEDIANYSTTIYPQTIKFHLMIAKYSHNQTLEDVLAFLMPQIASIGEKVAHDSPFRALIDISLHRDLLNAISTHDPNLARKAMSEHLADANMLYAFAVEKENEDTGHENS